MPYSLEELNAKWGDILDHDSLPKIRTRERRDVVATLLENTEHALRDSAQYMGGQMLMEAGPTNVMGTSSSTAGAGPIDIFDPVLISLVRRAMPNLIAYDICGVQPMSGPTGIIFALRSRYNSQTGAETFYNEVNTAFSSFGGANAAANVAGTYANSTAPGGASSDVGTIPAVSNNAANNTYNYAGGFDTAFGEQLGTTNTEIFPQMALTVDKTTVTANERALKAEYSMELAQDLKAVHGMDAESELSNILAAEILAEINREIVRTINVTANIGASYGTTTPGVFDLDTDANGRWSVEKFKGLMFQLEREANQIAKNTRRGRGNLIICSSDVASALQMAGDLDYTPALDSNNLAVDDTGNTFVGVLNKKYKVFIDPYVSGGNYATMGYKGSNSWDAGLFYCPYVPLQLVRAVDPGTFQPKIAFKTRYGVVANPFAQGLTKGLGAIVQDSNLYYNRLIINNIL